MQLENELTRSQSSRSLLSLSGPKSGPVAHCIVDLHANKTKLDGGGEEALPLAPKWINRTRGLPR